MGKLAAAILLSVVAAEHRRKKPRVSNDEALLAHLAGKLSRSSHGEHSPPRSAVRRGIPAALGRTRRRRRGLSSPVPEQWASWRKAGPEEHRSGGIPGPARRWVHLSWRRLLRCQRK